MRGWLLTLLLVLAGCATDGGGRGDQGVDARRQAAEPNALLGVRYLQAGQNKLAMTHLKRALYHDPDLPIAHNAIAVLYERLGMFAEAESHFKRVTALVPDDSDAHNNYGQFLCARQRYQEAEREFLAAVANPLYPTPENSYTNAGICSLQIDDSERAERYFKLALAKAPRFRPALLQMARLSWARQDALAAREYLKTLQQITNPIPEVLWLRIQVEQALGDFDASSSYALLLRNQFPESPEAAQLKATEQR